MLCAVCQKSVPDDAEECPHCGAQVVAEEDRTAVAGTRPIDTTGGPPRGEVIGERWEIRTRLESSSVMSRYRALDQESEHEVVVTLIHPDVVPTEREREVLRDKLAALVGIGNKFVPGLVAAEREGRYVWAVEPDAQGTTLREVLDARRGRGDAMRPGEVLPVVAMIATGISAIPPPYSHGDVRAERVRIHGEGLAVTGAFLLPSLPPAAVAAAITGDESWARAAAPEAMRGVAGDAADRFAVALIAFEALAGRPWTPGARLPTGLDALDEALRALLATDPTQRPRSLDALVAALAKTSALPLPAFEPAPFRRLRKPASMRPPSGAKPRVESESATATLRTQAVEVSDTPATGSEPGAEMPEPSTDPHGERVGPATDPGMERVGPTTDPGSERVGPATDPGTEHVGMKTEPGELVGAKTDVLKPDPLPPAYRLDDQQTVPESAKLTRRVVALQEPPPVVAPAPVAAPPPTRTPSSPPPARTPSSPPSAKRPSSRPPPKPILSADTTQPNQAVVVAELTGEATTMNPAVALAQLPKARAVAGAARGGTQEIAVGELEPVTSKDSAEVRAAASDIDPRLLRAALAPAPTPDLPADDSSPKKLTGETQQLAMSDLDEIDAEAEARRKKKALDDSLDPRLVRAALGVEREDPTLQPKKQKGPPTEPLRLDDVEVVRERPRTSSPIPRITPGPLPAPAPAPRASAPPRTSAPAPAPAPAAAPRASGPPAPRASGPPAPRASGPPAPRASAPQPAPAPRPSLGQPAGSPKLANTGYVAPQRPREPTPATVVPLHVGVPNEPARAQPVPSTRPPALAPDDSALNQMPRKRSDGMLVIWVSIAIALVIVAVGGFIAWRRHADAEADRERMLQQRFELLQHH